MKKILPFMILASALAVSGSAAFYSVYGLGKLFAGASIQVMVMAATLEIAKLVVATALHRYWKIMNFIMKSYLTVAVVLLIAITSAGIYGFLSSAYQVTAAKDAITTKQINILELKKERFDEQRNEYRLEKAQIVNSISELRTALGNPNQVQYIDKESGQLITTTSGASRRSLETQLTDAVERRDNVSIKIEVVTDSLTSLDLAVVNAEAASETSSELGPLKYVAGLTGKSMDVVVNWFLFLLIFVFDPLAVTLIILANFSFQHVYGKTPVDLLNEEKNDDAKNNSEHSDQYSNNISDQSDVMVFSEEDQEIIPIVNVNEVKSPPDVVMERSEDDIVVIQDESIEKPSDDETIVIQQQQPKRKILSNIDLTSDVAKHILDALPWVKSKTGEDSVDEKTVEVKKLNERQKANMSHQEIAEWYKKNLYK